MHCVNGVILLLTDKMLAIEPKVTPVINLPLRMNVLNKIGEGVSHDTPIKAHPKANKPAVSIKDVTNANKSARSEIARDPKIAPIKTDGAIKPWKMQLLNPSTHWVELVSLAISSSKGEEKTIAKPLPRSNKPTTKIEYRNRIDSELHTDPLGFLAPFPS